MLRAAVVGCGPRGLEHARVLSSLDHVALVGVAELDPARRAAAAAAATAPVFAAATDLLAQARPDIVVLATPAAARRPLVDAALESGVRAIVLEKPMAAALGEARRIVEACARAGVHAVVGHQLRFCPEFVALKEAIERGEIGRLHSLAGWCYGDVLDQGPHLLDMARWLAGRRKVVWVMSLRCSDREALRRLAAGGMPPGNGAGPAAPPWMVHHLAFDDGVRATIETGPLYRRSGVFVDDWLQKRVMAVGSDGVGEAQTAGYFALRRHGSAPREVAGTLDGYRSATRGFHEELRDVLRRGGRHRNDARDALESFELLIACAQSAVDGSIATWPVDATRDVLAELSGSGGSGRPPAVVAERPAAERPAAVSGEPTFSVIVPLPDHRGHALECVRSWTRAQDYPGDRYEVIVVGNGAQPSLESAVRGLLRPEDRLLRLATANELAMYHHGAEAARGRWLLFTEPHCTAEPGCLAELAAYLDRTPCAGACLRSKSGPERLLARLEARLFNEGFAEWSRPGDWRKVLMRGFALRRDVYREVGGFEHEFDRFAEWALAATLHARGFVLGYASGAAVRHFDTTSAAELFPPIVSFTRGECAYRAARPREYCERYFGVAPEWLGRHRLRRDFARALLRPAWRSLWQDGWGAGLRGAWFAVAMLREVLALLTVAASGPRLPIMRARAAVAFARLRLFCLSHREEARYRTYRRLWDAVVSLARIDYLARHDWRRPAPGASDLQIAVAEVPDDQLAGFHAAETWRGQSFRWMSPLGMMRLAVPPDDYTVSLDTAGVLGPGLERPIGVFWNGRKVPRAALQRREGRLSFALPREWFSPTPEQILTLTCAPLWRTTPAESRRLALPIFSLRFAPRAERSADRAPHPAGIAAP